MRATSIAALVALACAVPAAAQEGVRLSFFPRPGQVLQVDTHNRVNTEVDVEGEQLLRQSRERGARLPLQLERTERQRMRTTTGVPGADGSYPLTLEYVALEARTIDASGNAVPMPGAAEDLVGTRVVAQVRPPREITFVSADGPQLKPQTRSMLPQLLAGLMTAMEQLEAVTVTQGRPAVQKLDIQIPLPQGLPPLQLAGQAVYTLRGVDNGIARFGIALQYTMEQRPGGTMQLQATGTGEGTMDYDVERQVLRVMETDSRFGMSMSVPGGAIVQNLRMRQSVTQTPQ